MVLLKVIFAPVAEVSALVVSMIAALVNVHGPYVVKAPLDVVIFPPMEAVGVLAEDP